MALIEDEPHGVALSLFKSCEAIIMAEIANTRLDIKRALDQVPADMDEAKVLVSKLFGLQIASGNRPSPKLKSPVAAMRAQGRDAADAIALLTTG